MGQANQKEEKKESNEKDEKLLILMANELKKENMFNLLIRHVLCTHTSRFY